MWWLLFLILCFLYQDFAPLFAAIGAIHLLCNPIFQPPIEQQKRRGQSQPKNRPGLNYEQCQHIQKPEIQEKEI